jgi:hypothetical protein
VLLTSTQARRQRNGPDKARLNSLWASGAYVRRRAARGRWARMPGNDGRARIQVPADGRRS